MRLATSPLLLALPLAACGGAGDPSAAADAALARGDVDRAAALLGGADGPRADVVRAAIERELGRRESDRERIREVLAGVPDQAPVVVQNQLRELREDTRDRAVRAEIDAALSGLGQRYADAPRTARAPAPPASRYASGAASPDSTVPRERAARADPAWDPYASAEPAPDRRTAGVEPAQAPQDDIEVAAGSVVEVRPDSMAAAGARPLVDAARAHLRAGDLTAARDAYLAAAAAAEYGIERDEYAAVARDLDDRRMLRAELASAFQANPDSFAGLGFASLAPERVVYRGDELSWAEMPLEPIAEAAKRIALSGRALLGIVHEHLAHREIVAAWSALAELQRAGRVDDETVADVVARFRGERVPAGGYVFRSGDWIPRAEIEARERDARLAKLDARFAKVRLGRVDELAGIAGEYQAEAGEAGDARLAAALVARFGAAAAELAKDKTVKRLERLAARRAELDAARAAALELIFDEETYFYPYRPPECPPEKAALYPAVQRRVDELVKAVRDVWRDEERVHLAREYRELVAEIGWLRSTAAELGCEVEVAVRATGLPAWFDGVPDVFEEVALKDFAWDAAEAAALARDRAIVAYNERIWARGGFPAELDGATPDQGERTQVEITNGYRRMMGRCALAWDPRIQAACQDHSDYMSRTGDFGHFEPDPETKGPMERMRRRGYLTGRSENCALSGGPADAHDGWLHSSGHHRNILMPGHREMASAVAGPYWTQDFGAGLDFEDDL
jgi:hypothetical protein